MMCPRNEENTVGQLYLRNKLVENKSRFARQGEKEGELDEGSQKVQTSSYKY